MERDKEISIYPGAWVETVLKIDRQLRKLIWGLKRWE